MTVLSVFTHNANPPTNYIGTTIFLSYIAAALYLTFSITLSLNRQYTSISTSASKKNEAEHTIKARARSIKIFSVLAGTSFATLSWHMLNFLIASYLQWNDRKHLSQAELSGDTLKRWMLESTLFQDFARELVNNRASAAWTQVAILGSWFWGVWTAREARKHNLESADLWKFIALGQILPISFTTTLVIVQLHLSSDASARKATENPQKKSVSLALPTVVLNACLLAQPFLGDHPLFVFTTLLERLVLLLPYSGRVSLEDVEVMQSVALSTAFVVANLAMTVGGVGVGEMFSGVWHGGLAIKTLGWDVVLGGLVWAVLRMKGGL